MYVDDIDTVEECLDLLRNEPRLTDWDREDLERRCQELAGPQ